ncbi:protein-tyrosine dual specificity domain protein [Chrysochromulina tobinii]|uniref:Protein-tyrosine dual specificity domain protein n=1 Tax=Chrysochromulina tobinii TaxID=1460289 RepID=A0A0M0K146_9EUKA|nr:protein-tyrosine dual specificity domain protein [Chrysochromulina tobinii]|eukprot:KOO32113.1 protein-tyrosine dual specificity domain protein [Chrysochromulina sp. CCMP291]
MTGPDVSPTAGVGIYVNDPTQGPACALACPAATVYRNYLVQHEGHTGQHPVQIDNLKAVGVVVGNDDGRYWVMQNGYTMPVGRDSLAELAARLRTEPNLVEQAEAALRVGVHWETSVAPPLEHRVCQVYASALPCNYARGPPESDWEPFARLVLRAAYEATLAVGAVRSLESGGARVKCYLTALGEGVFGNRVKDQILRVYNKVVKDEQMPEKSRIATQLNFTFMGNPGTDALEVAVRRVARGKGRYGFGNGRDLRNAFESAASKARARANFDPRAPELQIEDVIGPPPERKTMPELDAALTQLDAMEGLHEVKAQIYTFVQVHADNYRREKSNEKLVELKKNRLFWGNPGTGKSTVAEIYGKVLKALGLLSNGEVILKTAGDFIGSVVGESQNEAADILQLAQGRVLVIDEASDSRPLD